MKNILVVDDDEVILHVIQALLEKNGFKVFTAVDGHLALKIIQSEELHLIVTDINLPHDLDGFHLVKTIRKEASFDKTPVMVLTGRNHGPDVVESVMIGANDFVVKPIDFNIFLTKVLKLIDAKKSFRVRSKTFEQMTGSWTVNFDILSISEHGLVFVSPTLFSKNFVFNMNHDAFGLFADIGISPPRLQVVKASQPKELNGKFKVEVNFVDMDKAERFAVSRWLTADQASKKGS